jgi:CheY-like chemotaxis protein
MVQGFIKQSSGLMEMNSELGVGTTVRLYFLSTRKSVSEPQAQKRIPQSSPKAAGNILVAEDDDGVRKWLCRHFELNGNKVTAAKSGDAALKMFNTAPYDFDLLISDIVMPGQLQGPELALEVRKTRPELPIIFMSGYPKDRNRRNADYLSGETYLMKPINSFALNDAIALALNTKRAIKNGS